MIVVPCPLRAERILQAGTMCCPGCKGRLRPHGHGRTRSVRGMGADTVTVTPRRARCTDCATTHILLPTALTVRRADTTEVIGNALVAKAGGAGFRTIATRLDRPVSTVRRDSPMRSGGTSVPWTVRSPSTGNSWFVRHRRKQCSATR